MPVVAEICTKRVLFQDLILTPSLSHIDKRPPAPMHAAPPSGGDNSSKIIHWQARILKKKALE